MDNLIHHFSAQTMQIDYSSGLGRFFIKSAEPELYGAYITEATVK